MPEPELFLLFVRPMNRSALRYAISGSVAAIFYGEPRLTHDVDFVIFLNERDIERLPEIFPANEFYLPPLEMIKTEAARDNKGMFNSIHMETGFKADFYLTGRDELNAWAFRFRRQIEFADEKLWLAPPECVIARKLEFYREGHGDKHLRDIRAILAVSGEQLDRGALVDWIERLGLRAEWQLAQS